MGHIRHLHVPTADIAVVYGRFKRGLLAGERIADMVSDRVEGILAEGILQG